MKPPLFSVVIPTYNHAIFLQKALDSLVSQTYQDWEAIVVNNFSTDNTESIVANYADPRIRLLNFSNQGVIAASRNQGLASASGEYVAFLDSDDYWYPEKLEACLRFIEFTGCDFMCHGEHLIENDHIIATWSHRSTMGYLRLLIFGNKISTSAVVVKRNILLEVGDFSTKSEFITAEDYELWLRILKKGYSFRFYSNILGGHLKHSFNQSSAVQRHFSAVVAVVEQNFKSLSPILVTFILKPQAYSVIHCAAARQFMSQMNFQSAFKFLFKAIVYNPFRVKNYVILGLAAVQDLIKRFV